MSDLVSDPRSQNIRRQVRSSCGEYDRKRRAIISHPRWCPSSLRIVPFRGSPEYDTDIDITSRGVLVWLQEIGSAITARRSGCSLFVPISGCAVDALSNIGDSGASLGSPGTLPTGNNLHVEFFTSVISESTTDVLVDVVETHGALGGNKK